MEQGSWAVLYERILKFRKQLLEGDIAEIENLGEWRTDNYTMIYNIYYQGPDNFGVSAQQLYDRYKESIGECMPLVLQYLKNIHGDGEALLREVLKRWENHNVMVRELSDWFSILDRYFVKVNCLSPLREAGLMSFRDHVYHEIKTRVKNAVFILINNEREGQQIDGVLLKQLLNFFLEIGIDEGLDFYKNDFEAAMLEDTRAYYSRKAALWVSEDSCQEYMRKADDCLEREKDRAAQYLHPSSDQRNLLEVVQDELLLHYQTQLLENEQSGCQALLRENNVHNLSRIYRLFYKIPNGLEPIASMFREHLISEGTALIRQAEEEDKYVELIRKVIELQDKYVEFIEDTFQNDTIFCNALKQSFQRICSDSTRFAEILAMYLHNLLQNGGTQKLNDSNSEIEKAMQLIEYISDKDLFAEFCGKNLALRLLFDQSANLSAEDSIIAKIKQQCGEESILNMEGMLKDMKLAEEGESRFLDYLQTQNIDLGMELNVKLLKTQFWPTYEFSQVNLPSEMVNCAEVFNRYYSCSTETKDRQLTWIYSLGTCHITGKFGAETVDMIVTTYQAVVLLLFSDNKNKNLSYANIKSQLNMRDADLVRVLHSLACSTYKILVKQPNSDTIDTTDVFEVNHNFSHKLKKTIQLSFPPVAVADEKKKANEVEVVDNDRQLAIDAAIVRIMKRKSVLQHSDLVKECIEELGRMMITPDLEVIEREIESLIEREYLEKDQENSDILKYYLP